MPQASERSLAIPMISPRLPAIRAPPPPPAWVIAPLSTKKCPGTRPNLPVLARFRQGRRRWSPGGRARRRHAAGGGHRPEAPDRRVDLGAEDEDRRRDIE